MTKLKIEKGDVVRFVDKAPTENTWGWNSIMEDLTTSDIPCVDLVVNTVHLNGEVTFKSQTGWDNYAWHRGSFELVRKSDVVFKLNVGDEVVRSRRFTASFNATDVHTVQRVTPCGKYIWVGGHRHSVPAKYFEKVALPVPVPPPELTEFDTPLIKPTMRTVGDNPHGCGLVAKTEATVADKIVDGDYNEIERHLVGALVLEGKQLEYLYNGKWFDVKPDTLTVSMIKRLAFRFKNLYIDFYNQTVPKPLTLTELNDLKDVQVYGVSFNNVKTFPCGLSTARRNMTQGYGMYWRNTVDANTVLTMLINPFKEAK